MNNYKEYPELIPQELIERAKKLSPAQISDGMKEMGIIRDGSLDADITPVSDTMKVVGTICTVATADGDNLPIHVALYQGKPGYVMMIDGKAYTGRPYLGELIARTGKAVGLEGIIIDGYVRDKVGIAEVGFPVFARGYLPRNILKKNAGEINVLITCGGVCVNPGDLVIGDCDGVVVVPRDIIEKVLEKAEKKDAYEIKRREVINEYEECRINGKELPKLAPDWVIEIINKKGE